MADGLGLVCHVCGDISAAHRGTYDRFPGDCRTLLRHRHQPPTIRAPVERRPATRVATRSLRPALVRISPVNWKAGGLEPQTDSRAVTSTCEAFCSPPRSPSDSFWRQRALHNDPIPNSGHSLLVSWWPLSQPPHHAETFEVDDTTAVAGRPLPLLRDDSTLSTETHRNYGVTRVQAHTVTVGDDSATSPARGNTT